MIKDLDPQDWQLLDLLSTDASDLDSIVAMTSLQMSEVRARLLRLKERGFITGLLARLDPSELGLPVTAYFLIRVAQTADTYATVAHLLRDMDQVEEAHAVSGQYDWLVKVRAEDVEDLQALVTQRLALIPGFVRAETVVVLTTACDRVNVERLSHPPDEC